MSIKDPITAEKVARLPKWAQDELQSRAQKIQDLQATVERIKGDTPTSVYIDHGHVNREVKQFLDPNLPVNFEVGASAKISVRLDTDRPGNPTGIRIMAIGFPSQLAVLSQSSNVVSIEVR